jgi:multidrug efflux system membrane fusion protein
VVPDSVIQRGPEGDFAFVIKEDQRVEVRPVKVAARRQAQVGQGETVIEDGLRPGERIVVDGQYKLQQGSRVKMADAAAKSEGRKAEAEDNPKTETRSKTKS